MPAEHAALLLARIAVNGQPLATRFTDAAIDANDAAGNYVTELSAAAQPSLYASYALLHKVVRLMRVHGVTALDDLRWLLDNAADVGVLAFGDLPVSAEPPTDLFGDWLALARLRLLRATVPSAPELLRLGSKPASTLAQLRTAAADFGLSADDLAKLDAGRRAPYRDLRFLARLCAAAAQIKRLGVSAATCFAWADRDTDAAQADIARQIRQTAKSKYEAAAWLSTVTPMQDNMREHKRDGLLAHLIEKSLRIESPSVTVDGTVYANRKYWRNSEDVFNYFLIDVDMSACQLTSRIQEAISAVQTFVQRCFLNVEKPEVLISGAERADQVSLDAWSQWKWMKNYRIWEANRKIFLYPENWIEPALRDDKSPFFVELENELLQGKLPTRGPRPRCATTWRRCTRCTTSRWSGCITTSTTTRPSTTCRRRSTGCMSSGAPRPIPRPTSTAASTSTPGCGRPGSVSTSISPVSTSCRWCITVRCTCFGW
ncbi:hypothetical protein NIIDMKKI_51840 [Mycobacterium kansasii]|uniref:ABC toxin N-terminal domain-containing protein n=1 Tax=Mycobacterium kansasii TaxID=1768 RepID=A0A7G1IMS5_MYCKA|nr:hypothetical protein NIIDMKKI_51840 [Mycobacterium kansasii]